MAECIKCIFPLLGRCPTLFRKNNAACLTLYKDRETCKSEDCDKCRYLKYCVKNGINLNK